MNGVRMGWSAGVVRGTVVGVVVGLLLGAQGVARAEDPLDAAAIALARGQATDAKQFGEVLHGSGEKTDYQLALEANKCFWFSGTSEKLEKLYMYLWAPGANFFTPRVADLRSPGQGTMAYCTKQAGMYKYQVKTEGPGHYAVAVFVKDAPPQAPTPAAAPVAEKPSIDLGAACDKRAAGSAPGAQRVGDFFDGSGNSYGHDDRFDFPIMLEAGHCYWIIAAGDPEKMKSLALYLWGPTNKRITEAKSDTPNPMIGHCATENGMFKFQAKITGGSGAFKAGLYGK